MDSKAEPGLEPHWSRDRKTGHPEKGKKDSKCKKGIRKLVGKVEKEWEERKKQPWGGNGIRKN